MGEQFDFEYIVIGSGFGGSVSALRLVEKGWSVAVLEMGKRFRPEDFPKTSWNLKRFLWFPKLLCYGIQQITLLKDVLIFHGAGVGGGSLVYANTLPMPPDDVFKDPRWPSDEDWKAKLAPYYDLASYMLGAIEATEIFNSDFLLKEICEDRGRGDTFKKHQVAVHFGTPNESGPDPFFGGEGPDRIGCSLCGSCMTGCKDGGKNTLDNKMKLVRRWRPWGRVMTTQLDADKKAPTFIPIANSVTEELAEKMNGTPQSMLLEVLGNTASTAHILGGATMGRDAADGVCDASGRVFGYDNFFIADGSIVPANLGVNPALTITALAEHVMAGIPANPQGTVKPAPRPPAPA